MTTDSRAMVYPRGGVRLLTAETDATVVSVAQQGSAAVLPGTLLISLSASSAETARTEAHDELELVNAENDEHLRAENERYATEQHAAEARIRLLSDQEASLARSLASRRDLLDQSGKLASAGLVSSSAIHEARENVEQILRSLSSVQGSREQIEQELSALERQHQEIIATRLHNAAIAGIKDSLAAAATQRSRILAPVAGFVDQIYVRPGDFVRAGTRVARLIADGPPTHIVTVLPQEQRAWVHPGDVARVSLDQFPREEYGSIDARVVAIGREIATADDLPPALSTSAAPACYRVDLELPVIPRLSAQFRNGMLGHVRFQLRSLSLVRAVAAPAEHWLAN